MDNQEKDCEEMVEDSVLIREYLSGGTTAFDTLYERYKRPLYAYLNRMTGNHALADDLFQQTWMRILKSLEQYESRQKFFSWMVMIAHNLAIDHFRKEKKSQELPLDDENANAAEPEKGNEPWREMEETELMKAVEKAASELAPELKEVFLLRRKGVSFKEIAEMQNCSINTVLGRMQYAVKNIRKQLNDWIS